LGWRAGDAVLLAGCEWMRDGRACAASNRARFGWIGRQRVRVGREEGIEVSWSADVVGVHC
jgi:hypothetical protein